MIYVASSWRNPIHIAVCAALRSVGLAHYDFKNPTETETGFHWSEVMPSFDRDLQLAPMGEYLKALEHPISNHGYVNDYAAMAAAHTGILVLPCGRSAHTEIGWMKGQGKRTAVLLDPNEEGMVTPELMYKMHDAILPNLHDLLGWLGVRD